MMGEKPIAGVPCWRIKRQSVTAKHTIGLTLRPLKKDTLLKILYCIWRILTVHPERLSKLTNRGLNHPAWWAPHRPLSVGTRCQCLHLPPRTNSEFAAQMQPNPGLWLDVCPGLWHSATQLGEIHRGHIPDAQAFVVFQSLDLRFTELRQLVQHIVQLNSGCIGQQ